MKVVPLAVYNLTENIVENNRPNRVIWAGILDNRFCIEVQRTQPYCGRLIIFDGNDNYKPLYHEDVEVSYDARFGPDAMDLEAWQASATKFIDNIRSIA